MSRPNRAARRRTPRAVAALAVPALAAGLLSIAAPAIAAPEPAVPTFQDGLSQAVFTTDRNAWITQEAWVESEVDSDRDGKNDLVHVDVTRVPETANGLDVPVLMEMSPYYAGGTGVPNWNVDHELGEPPTTKGGFAAPKYPTTSPNISNSLETTWVPRGYAVVHAESLGSGFSEGCPTSGGTNESLGGKAVIDWLNGRATAYTSTDRSQTVTADWATGSVGMIGTSYNGTLPIGVASTGVEGLEAIVPVSAISDWYNYYRANGAVRAPGGYQGEDLDVLADYVHTRPDQAICQPVIDELRAEQDRASGDRSEFWAERDYLANADRIHAATLVAHGLNDWNVMTKNASDLYDVLKANGVPHQIYLHQGGHGGNPTDTLLNRWFTRYLYHVENGVEALPKAYVQREDRVLTEYAEWPDPAAADVALSFGAASTANTVGGLDFAVDRSGRTEYLLDDASKRASTLATAAQSENRLVYRTRGITDAVRLSGTPSVSLELAVDRDKANLTALLVDYKANGTATIVSRGWMDVQNRNSDAVTDPIEPGTSYEFDFDFEPKDYVFAAGSSLGVVVMSSDNEYTVRPAAGTRLTLDPAKSSVSLPIVGGAAKLVSVLGSAGPGTEYQVITTDISGGALSMSISSDEPVGLEAVALTGVDQETTGSLHDVEVRDSRGTSAGWDLTAQVSDFTSGSGTILAENLGWTPAASVRAGELPTPPGQSSVVEPGAAVAPGVGIGDAATLCSSVRGASAGAFTCGAGLALGIPGSTLLGTYSGVLTLTLM
ncbi:Xaa-Pro dipeptidyl-peptidase [Agromyces seonyuensis]|uniref:Xaa-Pro dipeptidyl-peptidase n=1 Tax=Agromyces seonyuensis TaxID=2662446 RepID=A0A6I4NT17_9MICO|nr:Xaa-Pro dipeptidyl-peptidase [Agromyces seonyuensis]MWB97606.1 Xaa-Pro dipeptidyl-peptidase [Agromyces seonyuensis]